MNYILPFDTETTGKPIWGEPSGGEDQPHIVQLAAHLVDEETRKVVQTMDVIVKPDGWVIPDKTIEIHGITNEMAHDIGISEKLAVEMLIDMLGDNKRIAFNTTFDNRIIRIATKRYFGEDVIDKWKAGEYECAMLGAQKIMGHRPNLKDAYKHFTGEDLKGWHSAIHDVNACLDIYWGVQAHNELL